MLHELKIESEDYAMDRHKRFDAKHARKKSPGLVRVKRCAENVELEVDYDLSLKQFKCKSTEDDNIGTQKDKMMREREKKRERAISEVADEDDLNRYSLHLLKMTIL